LITDVGMGKRVPMKDFPTQGRYGVGTIAMAVKGKSKLVGAVIGAPDDKLVMLTTKGGARLTKFDEAPKRGRPARGGTVLKLKPGDAVEGLVPFVPRLAIAAPEPVGKKSEVRGRKSAAAKPAKKAPAPKAKAKTKKK
jgi:DNA gyrase/topoisomerase IV subunit A